MEIASVAQAYARNEASKHQKEATRLQQRQADSKVLQERRRSFRENRIRQAQIQAAAAQQGATGSSSYRSALGGLQSQFGYNAAQSIATQNVSGQISEHFQKATDWQTYGQVFGMASNYAGGYASIKGTK